jgi:plasmid stabilization system protein ParE
MPGKWSNKQERKYEHIKESAKDRGKSTSRAKEIAARTVNKSRRQKGQTPNKTTQGTGNPNTPLKDRSKQELYNRAKQLDVSGRSKMNKDDLVKAIKKKQG